VIEEECTGNGALAACFRDEERYRADGVIVTESTNYTYTAAHVGVLWFRIEVLGKSVHAAVAWKGENAIFRMIPIIHELQALDAELNAETHPAYRGIEHPINLNVGAIRGGDWPSSVAGHCAIDCRLSMYPGTSVEETRARIEAAIDRATERDPWLSEHPPVLHWYGFQSPGSYIAPEEPLVRMLSALHEAEHGTPLVPASGTGTNDMRNFIVYGGMPALCYGMNGFGAHEADEWLDLDSLIPVTRVLGSFILDWCGVQTE
jgi:acetylornithine deacetylase